MKKIIFLYNFHYTVRDIHRFGADYLMGKGYDVELWYIWKKGDCLKDFSCSIGLYEGNNYRAIEEKEFANLLEQYKDAVYLCYFPSNSDPMYWLIKSRNKYIMFCGLGLTYYKSNLEGELEGCNYNIFFRQLLLMKEKGVADYLRYVREILRHIKKEMLYEKYLKHNLPYSVITSTPLGLDILPEIYKEAESKFVHAQDYDRYLELKECESEEKYITYVDSGYGFKDYDSLYSNISNPFIGREDEYFQQLEELFVSLEENYKLPVLIAGHPHVEYNENAFGGRRIYYNKTAELIKKSKLVVMSMGTSINYVLLFKKDILAISSDIFRQLYNWSNYIELNYDLFNIVPCELSDEEAIANPKKYVKTIDDEIRNSYMEKYIKTKNSEERTIIEVVEDILLQMN